MNIKLKVLRKILIASASIGFFSNHAVSADIITNSQVEKKAPYERTITGYADALNGNTLYFPYIGQKIHLFQIQACHLPQWSIRPVKNHSAEVPEPMPCGAMAKSWLKRMAEGQVIKCVIKDNNQLGIPDAICFAGRIDLGREQLRVGLAHVNTPYPQSSYLFTQTNAMGARYGMWSTYVLDMNEWQKKALDKSNDRQPIADEHLLKVRKIEISPAFDDLRQIPKRTDR